MKMTKKKEVSLEKGKREYTGGISLKGNNKDKKPTSDCCKIKKQMINK